MYLYLIAGEDLIQSQEPPTEDDLNYVRNGLLDVVTIVGGKFVQYTGGEPLLRDIEERHHGQTDNQGKEGA